MSNLIPNLTDLLTALPASEAGVDAAELATAASSATSWADVDRVLDEITRGWATP